MFVLSLLKNSLGMSVILEFVIVNVMIVDTVVLPAQMKLENLLIVYVRMEHMTLKELFVKLVSQSVHYVIA